MCVGGVLLETPQGWGQPYPSGPGGSTAAQSRYARTPASPALGPEYLKKNVPLEVCLGNRDHLIRGQGDGDTHKKHAGVGPETGASRSEVPLQGPAPLPLFSDDVCPSRGTVGSSRRRD